MSTELAYLLSVSRDSIKRHLDGTTRQEILDALICRNPFVRQQKIKESLSRKKGLYSKKEVMERMGISKFTFDTWVSNGRLVPIFLPWFKHKGKEMKRYLAVDIDQLVRESYDTW